jgi:hypothetical protein
MNFKNVPPKLAKFSLPPIYGGTGTNQSGGLVKSRVLASPCYVKPLFITLGSLGIHCPDAGF